MPDQPRRTEERLTSRDGTGLLARSWSPAGPRASLLLVHGYAEHCARYEWTASELAARGYRTWAVDLRGHGGSAGARGLVSSFDAYLDDLACLHERLRRDAVAGPTFLLGHSMGGLVALLYALDRPEGITALALTSPLLALHPKLELPAPLSWAARRLARVVPGLRVPRSVNPAHVSRSPETVAAYASDPLIFRGTTLGWYGALQTALARVWAGAPRLSVPTWLAWAGADRLVDPGAHARWAARAPAGRVTALEQPGRFHELLNEPERDETLAALDAWLRGRT